MGKMTKTSAVAVLLMALAAPCAVLAQTFTPAAAPTVPKTIAGKPYSITPGATPGTWTVKWGDDTFNWKPSPWTEDPLKQQGPAYYAQWTEPGMPFPFEVALDQRDKLSATELIDRCVAYNYYGPYVEGAADIWNNHIIKPDGSSREDERFIEIYQSYYGDKNQQFLSPSEKADVSRKYLWIALEPEEVRGQSGVTTDFYSHDRHPEDTWYTPTVRKVRRLAGAVSKQFFPGTLARYEDVSHVRALPDLDYKVVGFELFKPDPTVYGFGPNDEPEVKRADGGGDVAVIIEITPKPDVSWWYAKRRLWCGLETMAFYQSMEYDASGKRIRTYTRQIISGSLTKTVDGTPAPDWWVQWGTNFAEDFDTGFKAAMWASNIEYNPDWPDSIFTNDTLVREPHQLNFWGK